MPLSFNSFLSRLRKKQSPNLTQKALSRWNLNRSGHWKKAQEIWFSKSNCYQTARSSDVQASPTWCIPKCTLNLPYMQIVLSLWHPRLHLANRSLGWFDFQNFSLIFAPVAQSCYFASKKTWEKYQIPKLKTVWMQNGLFYYIKSWI